MVWRLHPVPGIRIAFTVAKKNAKLQNVAEWAEAGMNWFIAFFTMLLVAMMSVTFFDQVSAAPVMGHSDRIHALAQKNWLSSVKKADELNMIRSVLESRIKNHRLPERALSKIAAMNADELRLVTSLCRRISETGPTVAADFALFLVTALIVVSWHGRAGREMPNLFRLGDSMKKSMPTVFYHLFVIIISAGTALSLPVIIQFITGKVLQYWALIQNEELFLVSMEIEPAITWSFL
jgi:hypothetical protein